jgi:hypothetical protein
MAGVPASSASLKDSCSLSWPEKGSYEEEDSLKKTQSTLDKLERMERTCCDLQPRVSETGLPGETCTLPTKEPAARDMASEFTLGEGLEQGNLHFNFIYQVRRPYNFMEAILCLAKQSMRVNKVWVSCSRIFLVSAFHALASVSVSPSNQYQSEI